MSVGQLQLVRFGECCLFVFVFVFVTASALGPRQTKDLGDKLDFARAHTRFAQFAVVLDGVAVLVVVPGDFHLIAYCFEFTNESAAIDQSNRVKSGKKHSNFPFVLSENVPTKISNVLYTINYSNF